MAKYAGLVGYVTQEETSPGIWSPVSTEKKMRGDVIRLASSFEQGEKVNDDINLQNRISLVGDPYAFSNFTSIKYVWYLGNKWKVTGVEVSRPRLILTLGGLWNG